MSTATATSAVDIPIISTVTASEWYFFCHSPSHHMTVTTTSASFLLLQNVNSNCTKFHSNSLSENRIQRVGHIFIGSVHLCLAQFHFNVWISLDIHIQAHIFELVSFNIRPPGQQRTANSADFSFTIMYVIKCDNLSLSILTVILRFIHNFQ